MSANEIVDTGVALPRMAEVRAVAPRTLIVTWAEGTRAGRTDRVDLAPVIDTFKIFRPLRKDASLFATARLGEDGDTVVWSGDNLEMHAETVELLAEQTMAPHDFVAFLKRNRLTQDAAATILGYSRRQIGYFTTTGPIPRVVALACKGYEAEQARQLMSSALGQ